MDIQEILAKAFDIGNKTKFTVRFYENEKFIESKDLTYTELGIFLIANCNKISFIDILQNKE